nr:hypothetical protein [Tanacetum cinerariifolium]
MDVQPATSRFRHDIRSLSIKQAHGVVSGGGGWCGSGSGVTSGGGGVNGGGGVRCRGWQRQWQPGGDSVVGRRMRGGGIIDRLDRETRSLFGFAGKIPPEKFSGGGSMVVVGGRRESIGSSPSLVILLDTEAKVMVIPVVLPSIPSEAPAIVVVAPVTATPDLAIESDLEVKPSEDLPSKAQPSPDYVPYSPVILHDTRATVRMLIHPQYPLPLGYRAAIARWNVALLSTPYPSHSLEDSASLSGSSSGSPSVPRSRLLPHRRHLVSSHSTLSASAKPSFNRCRSLTTSLAAVTSARTILSYALVDRLPPRKRLKGLSVVSYQDVTIEAATEPVSSPAHHGLAVKERLCHTPPRRNREV